MRDRPRTAFLTTALAAIYLCASCAAPPRVQVVHDPAVDLSGLRTWDWIDGRAVVVRAPEYDTADLERRLTSLVEDELRAVGLRREPGHPQLRVAALLVARRSLEAMRRPAAMQTVNSFHENGTYEVHAEVTDLRAVDRLRLAVFLTSSGQEQLLWQAQLDARYPGGFRPHLEDALASVLEDFRRLAAAPEQASP